MSNEYKEGENVNQNNHSGKVWLVGAGPNDPGLLTLKGKSVLEQADVVVYDHLVGPGILAMIPKTANLINVGKISGDHLVPQKEINQILVREGLKGNRVVRLKGGDPFVFGRGGEEVEELCANAIPFEIVPGVTSAISVPAYNGIPVTHRDFCSSVHIITGHTKNIDRADIDFPALVKFGGTLVFLMGVASMPIICKELIDAGMDPAMPAAILENGTTAHQRRVVSDLANLPAAAAEAEIKTPAIIVVGKVCSLAEQFHWAEDRPLGRLKILITRPKDRSSSLGERLRELGAEVVEAPTIETDEILNNSTLDDALKNIVNYDWIAFTSPFGVKVFFQRMVELKLDIRKLAGIKFAAIGSATQKVIEEKGILIDLVPETFDGKALGEALAKRLIVAEDEAERKPVVLIPRARIGSEEVLKPLEDAGIDFEDLPIYETTEVQNSELTWYDESVDYIAFTSASTVRGFVKLAGETELSNVKAVCIGEQTAQEAKKYGMMTYIAEKATIDSMVDCFLALGEGRR